MIFCYETCEGIYEFIFIFVIQVGKRQLSPIIIIAITWYYAAADKCKAYPRVSSFSFWLKFNKFGVLFLDYINNTICTAI